MENQDFSQLLFISLSLFFLVLSIWTLFLFFRIFKILWNIEKITNFFSIIFDINFILKKTEKFFKNK